MTEFDDLFDPQYAAVDLFTNRVPENRVFADAVLMHLERVLDGVAILGDPVRRNVVSFYGIGGIGKTMLSQRLEDWLRGELTGSTDWGDRPVFDQSVHTARIDFHGSKVVSAIDILLVLRAALAGEGRTFPAFDVGLAAWWALARPGEPLPVIAKAGGLDVRAQIAATLTDALGGALDDTLRDVVSDAGGRLGIGPFSVRMGVRIVDAVRQRRLRGRLLRECDPLVAITERARRDPSQDIASSLAGLLSWDFEHLLPGERPLVVAFADAAEYIQDADRVQEALFNRIVYLTPAILWVVTSQRSLDWTSPATDGVLPKTGPGTWPGLCSPPRAEPSQHLVGDLSDADVMRYLSRASGTGGTPVLSDEVMNRILRGAHGLPLYLDLSLSIARAHGGKRLDSRQFGGPLPALVTRVFADLPEEERKLARTASLLPRFDPALVARAAGLLEGDARRLCARALVRRDEHPRFPYRLHDAVRTALADEAPSNRGAWTAPDRLARAQDLLDALRQRHDGVLNDIDHRLDLLQLAAGLCAEHGIEAPWLRKALFELPGMSRTAERLPPPDDRTWMGQLSRFFEAWRGRTTRERIDYLEDLVTTPLPHDVARAARLFLAYAHRTAGDADRALPILQALLAAEPDSSLLRYQLGRTLHTLGRYDELDVLLRESPPADPTEVERLRSDLAFERGQLTVAMAGAAARAEYLHAAGRHRVATENQSAALWRAALAGRATVAECDAMIAKADRSGAWLIMRTSLAAKAICLVGDEPAVSAILAEAASIIRARSGFPGWREWSAELLHALRLDDRHRIAAVREQWDARQPTCTPNYRLVDQLFRHAGYPPSYPPLPDDAEPANVDGRWHAIISRIIERT
ncbi:tetratricopeptide repeat protein [Micromonospora sp. 4G57]|uniref:Tetratricopeptide repeat protein n=1 Tax=Micromonospora sicca TaxID=2202420 RepID=A0ABU5JMR8_9ACTN|nr:MULTISPECIES: tetratricopeptide repeat protein [unclassified Micromonospora]MDZ5447215.1 tetratricopeptide repeat protein [Micromonospora sp. 4G57]MDZ5493918.1 tetratricopeptide repeat protein [Micromonospora sp. 4G53]